jgi:Mat/Ecp fimbriae periplasmic chaperone
MKRNNLLLSGFLLLTSFISPAQANIVLNKIIVNFDAGGNSREDVEVWNSGKETLYVSTNVFSITNPENDESGKVEQTDPRSAGLVVSPSKIIVQPNERKILRILAQTTATEKDLVYRVKIAPKAGELADTNADQAKKTAGVKILIGYEMLIFVRPPNPHGDLKVTRSGKTATFTNAGNTNVDLREVKVCDADKTSNCQEIKAKRLYAGQTWTTDLPRADGVITVRQSVGMEFTEQVF